MRIINSILAYWPQILMAAMMLKVVQNNYALYQINTTFKNRKKLIHSVIGVIVINAILYFGGFYG